MLDRSRYRTDLIADIKLNHLFSIPLSGIFHLYCGHNRTLIGVNGVIQCTSGIIEVRIAQSITKLPKCIRMFKNIMPGRFFIGARTVKTLHTVRRIIIIETRRVTRTPRKRHIHASRRIDIPYQNIGKRASLLLSCIPLHQHCIRIFFRPAHYQRLTGYQNDNHRFARGLNGFQQFRLVSGKLQRRKVEAFTGCRVTRTTTQKRTARPYRHNSQITLLYYPPDSTSYSHPPAKWFSFYPVLAAIPDTTSPPLWYPVLSRNNHRKQSDCYSGLLRQ